jgi:hypothetical protein
MQSHPQERIDAKPEPSPMAIIGAILAQGAIRWMDRQKREQRASAQITSPRVASAKSPDATSLSD